MLSTRRTACSRSFLSLIGSLSELKEKDYGDDNRQISRTSSAFSVHSYELSPTGGPPCRKIRRRPGLWAALTQPTPRCRVRALVADSSLEVQLLRLEDLHVVGTLGVGGFGSVRLVVAPGGHSYALKCLNKNHVVATGQQDHVLGEKDILMSIHSPFIVRQAAPTVAFQMISIIRRFSDGGPTKTRARSAARRLFRTFRDDLCVYMLLEACLGGELWSMLRERGSLDEDEARFSVACVVQAVDYLHARRIVYRDLKPENLVLDARGYVKLVSASEINFKAHQDTAQSRGSYRLASPAQPGLERRGQSTSPRHCGIGLGTWICDADANVTDLTG